MSHPPKTYDLVGINLVDNFETEITDDLIALTHPPKSYHLVDNFVTDIHREQSKTLNLHERHCLLILCLRGFAVTDAASSKDFVVEFSGGFIELRLDPKSVRSPCAGVRKNLVVEQKLNLMDYERLHDGEWFNDRVMQFWKWWLQHGPCYKRDEIDFHNSLLFGKDTLARFRNRVSNPFKKKMVLIQLNYTRCHWNLAVLLNLDAIQKGEKPTSTNSPMPCMLMLDSCCSYAKQEHEDILAWLSTIEPSLGISKKMIPLFYPPVLQQEDSNSCGPLSILNAYCMISLHTEAFTYDYAGVDLEGEPLIQGGNPLKPFGKMVEETLEFHYSLQDIPRILGEMRSIIVKLSNMQRESLRKGHDATGIPTTGD